MKKKKLLIIEVSAVILALTVFKGEYLFDWAIHNWKFSLIVFSLPLILLAMGYLLISIITSTGTIIGIFTGNFLGNIIRAHNISKIVDSMSAEQVSKLRHHPGFEIWILFIIASIVIGIILHNLRRSK